MATILFTYEFGAGLGHLNRLLAVAKRLRDHQLVFALPDIALGRGLVEREFGADCAIRQAVVWPAPTDPDARKVPTLTFADVIRLFGFHKVELLEAAARRWLSQLEEIRPDIIVADFAPTLRLANQGRIPTIVVGNGYTVPPGGQLLLPMRPWESAVPAFSRGHEGELLAAVNEVRSRLGGAAIDYVSDLFQGESSFVCTLAEFDPYRRARRTAPLWPFNVPVISDGGEQVERDRIFAYFQAGHPALDTVLQALGKLGRRAEIYVQGADPRAIANRCARNVGVHTKPADFAAVLPRTELLVHHAGLGTAYSGLVSGVPQIVLPLNLEHAITTTGLEAFGSTIRVPVTSLPQPDALASRMAELLDGGPERVAAKAAADDLASRRDPTSAERVVEAVRALV